MLASPLDAAAANERCQITGRFDAELIAHLPSSVKFISHNGAGYDQIDVQPCSDKSKDCVHK